MYASQSPITLHTGQGTIERGHISLRPTQHGLLRLDNSITMSRVKDKETEDQESIVVKINNLELELSG